MHRILQNLETQTDHLISSRPDIVLINKTKKKGLCCLVNFAVSAIKTIKIKEIKKFRRYLDLARELKKLLNMRLSVIRIVVCALRTGFKSLEKEPKELKIRGRMEIIRTWQNWNWPEYWEEFWKAEETCCHLNSSERPPTNVRLKKSKELNNNNNNNNCFWFVVGVHLYITHWRWWGLTSLRIIPDLIIYAVLSSKPFDLLIYLLYYVWFMVFQLLSYCYCCYFLLSTVHSFPILT